jgi:hypothetical protein
MSPTCRAFALVLTALGLLVPGSARAADEDEIKTLARDVKSGKTEAKLRATEKLGQLGPKAAEAAKELCDALLDPNPKVSDAAIHALSRVRPDLAKPLLVVLRGGDQNRIAALKELGELGGEAEPVAYVLVRTLASSVVRDKTGRQFVYAGDEMIFATVLKIGLEDPEAVKLLKAIAGRDTKSTAYRARALEVLMDWAVGDDDRKKEMLVLLKIGLETPGLEAACCAHAARYGALAKDLLPLIKPLAFGRTEVIREAATKAVDTIEADLKKK